MWSCEAKCSASKSSPLKWQTGRQTGRHRDKKVYDRHTVPYVTFLYTVATERELLLFVTYRMYLYSCHYSDPALRSKKAVLISGTFHAINIPAGWKLKASVSTAGVGTTSWKKQTCHCGRVKYMTERRQEGKAVRFIRLDLKFCFLGHVLKELTVVFVLKIV